SLSADEYEVVLSARSNLMHALYIEEKLNYILDNFVEFERQLLHITIDEILFSRMSWSTIVDDIHVVNRRIVNLLAACRLYVDHVPHRLNPIDEKQSQQAEAFRTATREEHSERLGYRVLEALRNYVQHRGFP